MRLQLYGRDASHCIPDYSIIRGLLFEIVAMTKEWELYPWEKIFVIRTIGLPVHAGWLTNVYMECGCFSEAKKRYLEAEHPRKLGDICWREGKLDQAEAYYLQIKSEARPERKTPDEDRLIKLAFFQRQWDKVVGRFEAASFGKYHPPEEVCLGNNVTRTKTYLEVLAVALAQLNIQTPPKVLKMLQEIIGLTKKEWKSFLSKPSHHSEEAIARLKAHCRPLICKTPQVSLEETLRRGDTARAKHVITYMLEADNNLELAQRTLEQFGRTGEEDLLQKFLNLVTGSGILSISRSFLFSAFGHDSFLDLQDIPKEHFIRLLSSHPMMEQRHGRKLWKLKQG